MALSTFLRHKHPAGEFGGVLGLSGMFALQIDDWETEVDVKAKSDVPVFISHGKNDQMMPIDTAKMSYDHLKSKGIQFELFEENDLEHSLSMTTIANMKKFFHNHMV